MLGQETGGDLRISEVPLPKWVGEYGAYFACRDRSWQWARADAVGNEMRRRGVGTEEVGQALGYRGWVSSTNALRGHTRLSLRACERLVTWLREGGAPLAPVSDSPSPSTSTPTPPQTLNNPEPTALATAAPAELAQTLRLLEAEAAELLEKAQAPNTRRAYAADWADFSGWCSDHGRAALPADSETVVLYLTDRGRTCKESTLRRRSAAISVQHQRTGLTSPTQAPIVRALLRGHRRERAAAGETETQKAAIRTEQLREMLGTLPLASLLGKRDRALLLIGFSGACRRSELVSLDVADLRFEPEGLIGRIRVSKTDQAAAGRDFEIPRSGRSPDTCPVRALRAWLDAAGITEGPVFRSVNRHGQLQPGRLSDKAVVLVVKRCAEAVGLDPEMFAGHSLRAGFATAAARGGASYHQIQKQTGHKSEAMVRRYIREGERFKDSAVRNLGL